MGAGALTWDEREQIIVAEVRRFRGTLPGYDVADLEQECRIAVARGRVDPARDGARTYVRRVARNRLTTLLQSSMTYSRAPHDAWGRPRPTHEAIDDVSPSSSSDPEQEVSNHEVVSILRERLDPRDWQQLVEIAIQGASLKRTEDYLDYSLVRARAADVLARLGYRVHGESEVMMAAVIPEPHPEHMPDCHAQGRDPKGYDANDRECHNCRDKFTCLPRAIDKGLVQLRLSADLEVEAVLHERLPFMDAIARMKRRVAKARAGEALTADELPTWDGLAGEREEAPTTQTQMPKPALAPVPDTKEEHVEATASEAAAPGTAEEAEVKNAKGKRVKNAKRPQAAKTQTTKSTPPPKPKLEQASKEAVLMNPKTGAVKIGDVKIGFVKKTKKGWGWWSPDGKVESPEWLSSREHALRGLEKWARTKGPLVAPAPPASPQAKPNGKPAPQKEANGEPKSRKSAVERPKTWPTMQNGKPLPMPRELTREEMLDELKQAQSKLGANIELAIGYRLVRRKRDGDVVVEITPHGWRYDVDEKLQKAAQLKSRTQLFGSLSSVAMWAERRMVSGHDFFNLSKHNCTEMRDEKGAIIDRRGGLALRT